MNDAIRMLQPERVWKQFAAISEIPRCSKREEAVRNYVINEADRLGLTWKTDSTGNVVVYRPGAPSRKSTPTVVIQGHLDMVCEKNMGTVHDFDCDPITLVRDGEWLRADNTTLGADNGIAVAMMLALLEADDLELGPLECLFTVDEETGLTGALHLDPSLIAGRTLINLDSEEEGFFCIGCAGGRNTYGTFPLVWLSVGDADGVVQKAVEVRVRGLKGGHSGADIHLGRGNSLVLGGRLLGEIHREVPEMCLADISGGDKHNAIPREFRAVLLLPADRIEAIAPLVAAFQAVLLDELGDLDDAVRVEWEEVSLPERYLSPGDTRRIINLMKAMPHGVLGMSREVPGLVETSTNFAAIRVEKGSVSVLTSQRSSRGSLIAAAAESVGAVMTLAGGDVRFGEAYPAWPPRPGSPLLDTAVRVYRDNFGKEPEVGAFHAGLECGVIADRVGEMDMISFGPEMAGVHTPEERIHIESTERTWRLLVALLEAI
jgi:dipeptidase D